MQFCPGCHVPLERVKTPAGLLYACRKCDGRAVALAVLRKQADRRFLTAAWMAAKSAADPRACPHCSAPMEATAVGPECGPLRLDVCRRCQVIWFDGGELPQVPQSSPAVEARQERLSPELAEQMALFRMESQRRAAESQPFDRELPDSGWRALPTILGLPMECDPSPLAKLPWATWGLAAAMAVLFVLLLAGGAVDEAAIEWGFQPAMPLRHFGMTLFSSFLLHGGIFHVASNLYFFLIFGDNVEDRLGRGRFLAMLLGAHFLGLVFHTAWDPRGELPLVGASGGIAGVIAYYAIAFPHAKLGLLLRFGFIFRWVRISAIWALVFFLLLQLLGAWRQVLGLSNVSCLGHLGGLAVGITVGLLTRFRRKDQAFGAMAHR